MIKMALMYNEIICTMTMNFDGVEQACLEPWTQCILYHCISLIKIQPLPLLSHVGTSPEDQISVMDLNTIEQMWRRADVSNHGFGFGCHPSFAPPCCEEVVVVVEVEEVRVVIVVEEGVKIVVERKGSSAGRRDILDGSK